MCLPNVYNVLNPDDVNVDPDNDWAKSVCGSLQCPSCEFVRLDPEPTPVDIVLSELPCCPVSTLFRPVGVSVLSESFVKEMRDHLAPMVLGKCLQRDGREVPGYVSCCTPTPIHTRYVGMTFERCSACKRLSVDNDGDFSSEYILQRDIAGMMVFLDDMGFLYVAEKLADRTDWGRFPGVTLEPVLVRESSPDGLWLPGDPEWTE